MLQGSPQSLTLNFSRIQGSSSSSFSFLMFDSSYSLSSLSRQITGKSLTAAFTSVSEDSVDSSPTSEIPDVNRNEDATTLLEEPSSVTLLPSDITPSRKTNDVRGVSSTNCLGAYELDGSKFASVEAEIAVNFLRNVKPQVLNSANAAPQYRKLMDEIIEYVIRDLCTNTPPVDRDHFDKVLSAKNRMLFLCFFIWIIGISFMLFFNSDVQSGPAPT